MSKTIQPYCLDCEIDIRGRAICTCGRYPAKKPEDKGSK